MIKGLSGVGLAGVTAVALPSALASASGTGAGGESSPPTVPVSQSLLFHLDADAHSSGGVWSDLSGNGHHGTLGAGVTFVPGSAGVPAHFTFNGVDSESFVAVDNGAVITGSSPTEYTKMVWFRRDSITRFDNLLSSASASGQSSHFVYFGGRDPDCRHLTAGHGTAYFRFTTDFATSANAWLFAAVRFSTSSGFHLYINSSDTSWVGTPGLTGSSPYNAATDALNGGGLAFVIGSYNITASLLGDVAVALAHDVDIGDAAVKSYFASTVGRFHP